MDIDLILQKPKEERSTEELSFVEEATLTDEQKAILAAEDIPAGDTGTAAGDTGINGDTGVAETPEQKAAREARGIRNEHRIVREQNVVLTEQLAQVGEIPEPTTEQLKAYEPEWDQLTPMEQRMTIRQWKGDQRDEQIHKIAIATKNDQEWNKSLDRFVDESEATDTNPEVVKNRDEFIKFATKKTHRGVPVTILADAFLTYLGKQKPAGDTGVAPAANLMEPGSGGGVVSPNIDKKTPIYTPEQLKVIRETDYKRYREIVKSGQAAKTFL